MTTFVIKILRVDELKVKAMQHILNNFKQWTK